MMDMLTSAQGDTRTPEEKAKDKKRNLMSDLLHAKGRLEEAVSINRSDIQADPDAMRVVAGIQSLVADLKEAGEMPDEEAEPKPPDAMSDDEAMAEVEKAGFGGGGGKRRMRMM